MAQLARSGGELSGREKASRRVRRPGLRRLLAVAILVAVLLLAASAEAQRRGRKRAREPMPPRPQQAAKPVPWLLGFGLLVLAWYPAFKNSKRELER